MEKSKLERISDYAVILIAILAFVLSIVQTRIQQKHNKLSVRPLVNTLVDQMDTTMSVYIINKGVGPALVKDVNFFFEGKKYDDIEKLLIDSGLSKFRKGGYTINSNTVISANESRLLVIFKGRELKGVRANLEYESVYEERYNIDFRF